MFITVQEIGRVGRGPTLVNTDYIEIIEPNPQSPGSTYTNIRTPHACVTVEPPPGFVLDAIAAGLRRNQEQINLIELYHRKD